MDTKEFCFLMRDKIEAVKGDTQAKLSKGISIDDAAEMDIENADECMANIELAYRHLEDARMRFGKAVQACDGGKSCYKR